MEEMQTTVVDDIPIPQIGSDNYQSLQQPTQTEEREVEINKKPRTTDSYGPKFKCGCGYDTIRGNRYCPNCGAKIKRVD